MDGVCRPQIATSALHANLFEDASSGRPESGGALIFDRNDVPRGHRLKASPAWRLWRDASDVLLRTASMLGLTPADRSRLTTPASGELDGPDPARLLTH